jgi:hypothetical protein
VAGSSAWRAQGGGSAQGQARVGVRRWAPVMRRQLSSARGGAEAREARARRCGSEQAEQAQAERAARARLERGTRVDAER